MEQTNQIENNIVYPKFRWFVLIVVTLLTAINLMGTIAPAPLVESLAKDFGIPLGSMTIFSMMTIMLAAFVGAVIGGFLMNKIGLIPTWLIGAFLLIAGSLLMISLSNSMPEYITYRVMQGFGGSTSIACVFALNGLNPMNGHTSPQDRRWEFGWALRWVFVSHRSCLLP